jgi:hypothetical protein
MWSVGLFLSEKCDGCVKFVKFKGKAEFIDQKLKNHLF